MMFGRIVPGDVQLFQSLAGFATSLTDPTAFFHLPELAMFGMVKHGDQEW